MLEHCNTVDPLTQLSPAMIIFGRELKGFLPAVMTKYQPKKEWRLEADKGGDKLTLRGMPRWRNASPQAPETSPL